MNTRLIGQAFTLLSALSLVSLADAQKVSAERGLIGIKIFDSSKVVLRKYGTPDEVQPINLGGNAAFGGGAGGGAPVGGRGNPGFGGGAPGPGGFGGPPGGFGGPGRGGGANSGDADFSFGDFSFTDEQFRQSAAPALAPPGSGPGGAGGQFNPGAGGFPGAGRGAGGGAGAPANAGSGTRVTLTRWVYNRKASKYAFIIDRMGRVVQIEAIGLQDPAVKTAKGVSFGADFKTILLKYDSPDGYEISGDNIFIKYLVRNKVGFKLSRLGAKKPQVVTGIVVAAGKS